MTALNSTPRATEFFQYKELLWGDLIYGTKHLLQKIGIGKGVLFPGEEGGPKKKFSTVDPRGFGCVVAEASHMGNEIFSASIRFPGRERQYGLSDWEYFAPGVQRKVIHWSDEFIGTADDLIAASIVPPGYFPGLPGMRKTRVTILPDGSLPQGAPTSNFCRSERGAGTKSIERASRTKFRVTLTIPEELAEQRSEAFAKADAEWEQKMLHLPRPPRLDALLTKAKNEEAVKRRSGIHLVRNITPGTQDDVKLDLDDSGSQSPRQGRYHYPKSMLRQAYFCRNGNGDWYKPTLSLSMLSSKEFTSPIGQLLDQLEAEGHDVSGARIEWCAFRESAATLSERVKGAFGQFFGISDASAPLSMALYDKLL